MKYLKRSNALVNLDFFESFVSLNKKVIKYAKRTQSMKDFYYFFAFSKSIHFFRAFHEETVM